MKTAKLFLADMYVHLILSIIIPISILLVCSEGWNAFGIGLLLFYIMTIGILQVLGWVCVAMAVVTYKKGEYEKLRKSWKLLKFGTIPFYILNFIYSVFVWFLIVAASRGILIFLVPIPIFITCLLIFQSGCVGWCYIRYLRKQPEKVKKPSGIHYVLQVISVLDIISTIVILKKYD